MRFFIKPKKKKDKWEWHKVFVIFPRRLYDGDTFKDGTNEYAWMETVERKYVVNEAQRCYHYIYRK